MIYETVKSFLFYLDTSKRSGGTIGSPQFVFPNNLIGLQPQAGEKIRLTMQEAAINYTFYQTESYNNKFVVLETKEGLGGAPEANTRLIELEIGNYNLNTFILEITNKLNQNSFFSYVVTFDANTNTLRFTVSPKANIIVNVVFDFNNSNATANTGVNIEESCNEIMGFPIDSTITLATTGSGRTTQSSFPITMAPGVENLFVTITNQCQNYGNTTETNNFSSSNVLAKIPVAIPPYGTLYFFDLNGNFSTVIDNKYLDNLNITLRNERQTRIEPRKNWTFAIKVDILRPRVEEKLNEAMQELLELTRLKFLKKSEIQSKDTEIKNIV